MQKKGSKHSEESKKGDFVIKFSGKSEFRTMVEAKDWESITSTKIHKELDESLENRSGKVGIFVTKWVEALSNSVGCFNCMMIPNLFADWAASQMDRFMKKYCRWLRARSNLVKKSNKTQKVDFELVDSKLNEIKKQLDAFGNIQRQCTNISTASTRLEIYVKRQKVKFSRELVISGKSWKKKL
jgi:hypothetical protein